MNQKTLLANFIGERITIKWATLSSYDYEYETVTMTGFSIDPQSERITINFSRSNGDKGTAPVYQVPSIYKKLEELKTKNVYS